MNAHNVRMRGFFFFSCPTAAAASDENADDVRLKTCVSRAGVGVCEYGADDRMSTRVNGADDRMSTRRVNGADD